DAVLCETLVAAPQDVLPAACRDVRRARRVAPTRGSVAPFRLFGLGPPLAIVDPTVRWNLAHDIVHDARGCSQDITTCRRDTVRVDFRTYFNRGRDNLFPETAKNRYAAAG